MIRFAPAWGTSGNTPLDTIPLVEGTIFSFNLEATDVASAMVPVGEVLTVEFSSAPGSITNVYVNQIAVALDRIGVSGSVMSINANGLNLAGTEAHVSIHRAHPLTFSRLSGQLPPGLVLESDGTISGALSNVPTGVDGYLFAVRVSNGSRVRDRSFTIRVAPQLTLKTFVSASLPSVYTDASGLFDYIPLASIPRADAFIRTFEITNPDGDEELAILPSAVSVQSFDGPPPGVRIEGMTLRGTVAANAPAGRYIFRVALKGFENGQNLRCEIVVLDELATYVAKPIIIEWETPEGLLGEVKEGFPVALRVKASHEGGDLSYALAPGTQSLPKGMRVNQFNGDIEGVAPPVNDDTVFEFIVRATFGGNFVDRTFSLRVTRLYTTSEVLDVRLKLRNRDAVPMVSRYAALVDSDLLFRPGDPSFGMPSEPYIYLIKGVAAAPFANALTGDGSDAITVAKDYHGPLTLVLERHKVAIVRDGNDVPLYEVVYRELYDPQAKAGGFSFTSEEVLEQRVIHAQSKRIVYATSLRNARLDLVRDCAFPTADPALHLTSGPDSAESMPQWMTSRQIAGDPSSVLGYVPALVVANVEVGKGEALAATLNADTGLAPAGRQIVLDRYYLYTISYATPTTFDGGSTTFDGPPYSTSRIAFDLSVEGDETPIQV